MTTFTLDTAEFQATFRRYMLLSKRELSKVINARTFYVWLRIYALLTPSSPAAKRMEIKRYMEEIVQPRFKTVKNRKTGTTRTKLIAQAKQVRRKHLIAQARRAARGLKGLYGEAMTESAKSVAQGQARSVGYMKAAVVKALKAIGGVFAQFGTAGRTASKRKSKKEIAPNAALVKIGAEYGVDADSGNVGVFKSALGRVERATPGINPVCTVDIAIGTQNPSALSHYDTEYAKAYNRAIRDERIEMERHIADTLEAAANQAKR